MHMGVRRSKYASACTVSLAKLSIAKMDSATRIVFFHGLKRITFRPLSVSHRHPAGIDAVAKLKGSDSI
jgi:hypothetical protein